MKGIFQKKVIKMLSGTLRTGKIPNAFLFIGDPYIGKTETAIAYAKALNCNNMTLSKDSEEFEFCNQCQSCKKIDALVHPDVKLILPEKEVLTVNLIREIEEFIYYRALESKYKVVIVKEAHRMNISAANAFLKTLEEPPLNTTIILTCENIYSLPEPLISRCFKIYFTPLPKKAMEDFVSSYDNKTLLLSLAMGRPGFLIYGDLLNDVKWFIDSLNLKGNKRPPWKENEDIKRWIDFFCIVLRDMLVCRFLSKDAKILSVELEQKDNLQLKDIFDIYDKMLEIRKNIDLNLNKSIVWNYTKKLVEGIING